MKKQKWNERVEGFAEQVKLVLQMLIGLTIVLLLAGKLALLAGTPSFWPDLCLWLRTTPVLEIVGAALGVSAAIELAYMLYTPGPDEAVEPLIAGIAAAILILISREEHWSYERILLLMVLILSLALLFWVR